MREASPENQPLSIAEALAAISLIIQECSVMGANDYELPELRRLQESVKAGEIDPAEAVNQAEAVKASKQDYH